MAITARIPDDEGTLPAQLADLRRMIRELGPSVAASFLPVVSNLEQTINDKLAAGYYTRTQTDNAIASKVASPGDITPANVFASATVSGAAMTTPTATITNVNATNVRASAAPATNITATRVAAWIQSSDGLIGTASSSRRYKQDIVDADLDVAAVERVLVRHFHYIDEVRKRDDPDYEFYVGPDYPVNTEIGLIAEELHEAGLVDFVVYSLDDEGNRRPEGVHYELLALALFPVIRAHSARLSALERRLDALGV